MPFDNGAARDLLAQLLRQPRRAVLLVGAGSSIPVGYPSWPQLIIELRDQVVPELTTFPDGDLLSHASAIRATLEQHADRVDRRRLYEQYFSNRFRPLTPSHALFHRTLIQLPFCGFATTNYDPTIESAATYVWMNNGQDRQCEAVDLCSSPPHLIFRFLRDLGGGNQPSSVLHVHGFWNRPDQLVLTREDYETRYGLRAQPVEAPEAVAAPLRPLFNLHRKVVWSLLTMYPVVFVGFSVEDPAFELLLEFVHEDFELAPHPPAHFALLGSRDEDERDPIARRLRPYSVMPVFYPVIIDAAGNPDHTGLTGLIEEIAAAVGAVAAPPLGTLTQRLMER